jgi:hypothetical protein
MELMMHRGTLFGLATLAVCLSLITNVQAAGPVATQSFADIGTTTAGGSASGDINTATSFTLGNLVTTSGNTGNLAGLPTQTFGAVSFNISTGTSLDFTSAAFGTFASTSITEATNVSGAVAFYVLGNYTITSSSYAATNPSGGGATPGTYPASFTISLTQTPATNGQISASATFSVPPAVNPIPEPAGIVLGLTSLVMCGTAYRFRRRRSSGNAAA